MKNVSLAIAGVLTAAIIGGCSAPSVSVSTETESRLSIDADSDPAGFSLDSLFKPHSEMDDWVTETPTAELSGFCYDQLNESTQSVYGQLYAGVSALKPEFYIECNSTKEIEVALKALLDDHPEIFWLDGSIRIYGAESGGKERITPAYNIDLAEIPQIQAQIDAAFEEFRATIPTNASAYQIVRAAYQYLIRTTDYVTGSPQNQNIQSVFLSHQSVCAGYAKAFQYLLNRVGIPCAYVHGTIASSGESHAWNLVGIDGVTTWVDPTWGDPTYGENADDSARLEIIYDYLCMTDGELQRTGHIPDPDYTYPEVNDTTYDFYRMINDYLIGYDPKVVQNHIFTTVNKGDTITYLKFDSFESYAQAVEGLFGSGDLMRAPLQAKMKKEKTSSVQYYYSTSDEMLTIKIFW